MIDRLLAHAKLRRQFQLFLTSSHAQLDLPALFRIEFVWFHFSKLARAISDFQLERTAMDWHDPSEGFVSGQRKLWCHGRIAATLAPI